MNHGVHRRCFDAKLAGQAGHENEPVADVLVQIAMIELRLGADADKTGRRSISLAVIIRQHVALAHAEFRIGKDRNAHLCAGRNALPVDCLDPAARSIADTFLVEQEVAAGALDTRRVGQRDGGMYDRVGILQTRLHNFLRGLHARIDVADEL